MGKKILVLCTGNSCRSQIAEGYLRYFIAENNNANTNEIAKKNDAEVYSAGIETHGVNPKAIATMCEDGIDISQHTSNHIDEYQAIAFDFVITVCDNARENCPFFPTTAQLFHFNFPDPAKFTGSESEVAVEFARVRDLIKVYCKEFCAFLGIRQETYS